jgi:hypothetical protein
MAKQIESNKKESKSIKRPGVHSKSKTSKLKSSKNYVKKNRGQGK